MLKPLCGSQQTGKFLEMGIPDNLTCLLRNLYVGQLESDMEQWTSSNLEKKYVKAVYFHLAYLSYMKNPSC